MRGTYFEVGDLVLVCSTNATSRTFNTNPTMHKPGQDFVVKAINWSELYACAMIIDQNGWSYHPSDLGLIERGFSISQPPKPKFFDITKVKVFKLGEYGWDSTIKVSTTLDHKELHEYLNSIGQKHAHFKCKDCGKIEVGIHTTFHHVNDGGRVCNDCINEYKYCQWKCEYFNPKTTEFLTLADDKGYITKEAYKSGRYFTCTDCGEVYHNNYKSSTHEGICTNCTPAFGLQEYSFKPRPKFFGKEEIKFGVELEVECSSDNYLVAEKLADKISEKIYMKKDGSLIAGIEFVTHPCDIETHKELWAKTLDQIKAVDRDVRSDDVKTCGLHVHVGKNHLKRGAVERLRIFAAVCKDNMETFSRRTESSYAQYPVNLSHIEIIKREKEKDAGFDRYRAVNTLPKKTVEFRMFKGTIDYGTLISTIEFVKLLVEFCNDKYSLNGKKDAKEYWKRFLLATNGKRSDILNDYLINNNLLTLDTVGIAA